MTPLTAGLVGLTAVGIPVGHALTSRRIPRSGSFGSYARPVAIRAATPVSSLTARRRAEIEERLFDALSCGDRERVSLLRQALAR